MRIFTLGFFCTAAILLFFTPLSSQAQVWASLPCDLIPEDSTLEDYMDYDPMGDDADEYPKALNMKAIRTCIGRDVVEIYDEDNLADLMKEDFLSKPNIVIYGVLIDPEGKIKKVCQAEVTGLPDDQFKLADCIEKLKFKPAFEDGESIPSICFMAIAGTDED